MDYRYFYKPQRLQHGKRGPGTKWNGRTADQANFIPRHFDNDLFAPQRLSTETKIENADLLPSFLPAPLGLFDVEDEIFKRNDRKSRSQEVKKSLFERRDRNRGISKDLKMKISKKNKDLRASLKRSEDKRETHPSNKFKLPLPTFLKKEKRKPVVEVSRKIPVNFKPEVCSTPFNAKMKDRVTAGDEKKYPVDRTRHNPSSMKQNPWDITAELDITQDKMERVREWRNMNQPEPARDFEIKPDWREQIQLETPRHLNFKVPTELAVTQNKMERVRNWRRAIQPEPAITKDKMERDRNWRREIQPEAPRRMKITPEMAFTQDKIERARERKKMEPERKPLRLRDLDVTPLDKPEMPSFLQRPEQPRAFYISPERPVTQDKMERVKRKEKVDPRPHMRYDLPVTLKKYQTDQVLRNERRRAKARFNVEPADTIRNTKESPKLLLTDTFLNPVKVREDDSVWDPHNTSISFLKIFD